MSTEKKEAVNFDLADEAASAYVNQGDPTKAMSTLENLTRAYLTLRGREVALREEFRKERFKKSTGVALRVDEVGGPENEQGVLELLRIAQQENSGEEFDLPPMVAKKTSDETLERLRQLPENWDSYKAMPVDSRAVECARELIKIIEGPPDIVPLNNGGLQLEWFRNGFEVELAIPAAGAKHFLLEEAE